MYGCTVLFVHHVGKGRQGNKPEKDQLLGSTGIEGKMRNVLMLSIVNDQHQLSIAKGNYVNTEDKKIPLYLNFDNNTLTFSRADGPAKPKETEQCGIDSTGSSEAKGKPGRQKNMALVNKAIQLDKEGKSGVEIAKIIGMHKSTISKWIKEYKSGLVSE
jgi:RecA-family ATPase